jgi:2-keto-3-deoxy-6-phosphogluconate aldolase
MTVPGAVGIIEQIAKRYGDEVLVARHSCSTLKPLRTVFGAAQFVVSPALNLETIAFCRDAGCDHAGRTDPD